MEDMFLIGPQTFLDVGTDTLQVIFGSTLFHGNVRIWSLPRRILELE